MILKFIKVYFEKRKIRKYFYRCLIQPIIQRLKTVILEENFYKFFMDIGVDDLEKIIIKGNENRKIFGHTNYRDLAEYYSKIIQYRLKK